MARSMFSVARVAFLILVCGSLRLASAQGAGLKDAGRRDANVTRATLDNGMRVVMQTGDTIRSNGRRDAATFRIIGTRGQIEFWGWEPDYHLTNAQHPEGKLIIPEELPISLHQRHLENLLPMPEHKISEPSD